MTDNLDLTIRRKRLGLTLANVRDLLAEATGKRVALSALSDFENGKRSDLPHGLGRAEYEAIIAERES